MSKKKITVIVSKECPHCKSAVEYLRRKQVDIDIIDADSVKDLNIMTTPIICKDKKCIVGFDKKQLDELIEK